MSKTVLINQVRSPVRRIGAESYLLLTLLSFAGSISATRLFLELTGYPQLGGGELHIAHVLWGGLFLFMAALLPILLANRWVYSLGAVMAGIGVGLFVDEVGKFITQNNNYFYPPAAPIIYAFFLLTVLLYMQIRRPPPPDPRSGLYYALEALEEVLDRDLDSHERSELIIRLQSISQLSDYPELSHLANELLNFLSSSPLPISHPKPNWLEMLSSWMLDLEKKYINRLAARAILAGGMVALGVNAIIGLFELLFVKWMPAPLQKTLMLQIEAGRLFATNLDWFAARLALEGATGVLLLISAVLLISGKEERGIAFSYLSLLISLAGVNLVIFYFDQFSTIILATVQFIILLGVLYYRKKYLRSG